jgi:6-pyruvoyltetrahydropterin/6-carboxytetrahydropterin synthase
MIQLTKIFHFEMAHAIHGYEGPCKHVHGHSYELHLSITGENTGTEYIPAPGFEVDFKDIKQLVVSEVIDQLDHKLVLSHDFLAVHPSFAGQKNLVSWEVEPSAENLLIFIAKKLKERVPAHSRLSYMKLYETKNSYAEWFNPDHFKHSSSL